MTDEMTNIDETTNPDEAQTEEQPTSSDEQQETAPAETGEKEPREKPKYTGFHKRIKKLVRQKHELRERLERAEAELAKLKNPPSEEEFETDVDFINARVQHETEKRFLEREKQEVARQVEDLETEEQRAQREAYVGILRAGIEKYPDFSQKVLTIPLPEYVAQAVMNTDDPVEALYYLGNNPVEAVELAALSPEEAVERIKGLPKEQPKTSPPPVTEPVAPTNSGNVPLRDDLPVDEWIRRREAALNKR